MCSRCRAMLGFPASFTVCVGKFLDNVVKYFAKALVLVAETRTCARSQCLQVYNSSVNPSPGLSRHAGTLSDLYIVP